MRAFFEARGFNIRVSSGAGGSGMNECAVVTLACVTGGASSSIFGSFSNGEDYSLSPTAIMATLFDGTAALTNAGYAIVGDVIGLMCPQCYGEVVWFYQYYSIIPNSISTMATAVWIADGIIKGENNLSISRTSGEIKISLSVSQDTLVSVVTNVAGWTVLREPNLATLVDVGVFVYDSAGLGIPGTNLRLPVFINPTITYSTKTGWDFSW